MVVMEAQKPAKVMVTHNEAILQGEPLNGLVDRVAAELDKGARIVDMRFPGGMCGGELFAVEWCGMKDFTFGDGSTARGKPIDIIYQTLNKRGYNVTYSFGSGVPNGAIRISVRE